MNLCLGRQCRIRRFLAMVGRVPLLFYVLHLYLIHALAVIAGAVTGHDFRDLLAPLLPFSSGTWLWTSHGLRCNRRRGAPSLSHL